MRIEVVKEKTIGLKVEKVQKVQKGPKKVGQI
jgi:hypothetical protein